MNPLIYRSIEYLEKLAVVESNISYSLQELFPHSPIDLVRNDLAKLKRIKDGNENFDVYDRFIKSDARIRVKKYLPVYKITKNEIDVFSNPIYDSLDSKSKITLYLYHKKATSKKMAVKMPERFLSMDHNSVLNDVYEEDNGLFYLVKDFQHLRDIFDSITTIIYDILDIKSYNFHKEGEPEIVSLTLDNSEGFKAFYENVLVLIEGGATGLEILELFLENEQYWHIFITDYALDVGKRKMKDALLNNDILGIYDMIKEYALQ